MEKFDNKVRLTIPEFMYQILETDSQSFLLNNNKLCNLIFTNYAHSSLTAVGEAFKNSSSRILQFTLSPENLDTLVGIDANNPIENKAELFRNIFFAYCNQAKYQRERALFAPTVALIEDAIQQQKQLKVRYKNDYRTIEPFLIIKSDGETRNYVFAYCDKHQEYRNYRLFNLHAVAIINKPSTHYDAEYIAQIKANFDAFMSFGKQIKVRLDNQGQQMLVTNITHRPKTIKQEQDIFTFECSTLKAQLYFPQFMEHAEIVEPLELRDWFRDKFNGVAKLYQ